MKAAVIEELLDPIIVVLENISDPEDIAHLKLALNRVRSDLSDFFGEVFDPEDPYDDPAFMAGLDDAEFR